MSRSKVITAVAVNLCRFAVALTFIFSGYVKAIDPLGTQYKLQDYLEAWQLAAYVQAMDGLFGAGAATVLGIRPVGPVEVAL